MKLFTAVAVSYFFPVVLDPSFLQFLLISEIHRAEDSKGAQKEERSVSEVIAQCRRLKLQHL